MLTERLTICLTADELRVIRERAEAEERSLGFVVRRDALRPWLQSIAPQSAPQKPPRSAARKRVRVEELAA